MLRQLPPPTPDARRRRTVAAAGRAARPSMSAPVLRRIIIWPITAPGVPRQNAGTTSMLSGEHHEGLDPETCSSRPRIGGRDAWLRAICAVRRAAWRDARLQRRDWYGARHLPAAES